jgi:hypothetical protein
MAELSKRHVGAVFGAGGLAVLAAVALMWPWDAGNPSAEAVRDAVHQVVPAACPDTITIRDIDDLGGPGLPEGMRAARQLACAGTTAREGEGSVLAVQYVFSSARDARRWLRDNEYRPNVWPPGWWLQGDTLVGAVGIGRRDWTSVVATLR